MNTSIELDPKEVLLHLHDLGYNNINPQQLQEFIRDLERLIRYDRARKMRRIKEPKSPDDSTSSTIPNTTDGSTATSPSPPPVEPSHLRNQATTVKRTHSTILEEVSCSSSESSIAPPRHVLRDCTKGLSQNSQQRENLFRTKSAESSKALSKSTKTCDCAWRRIGCKCCEEEMSKEQNMMKNKSKENLAPPRPKSSFIRTSQTIGNGRVAPSQRCDPVALYQQYQQLWKQAKLPGEDNHNDLRWSVRERLLGQHPQPRNRAAVVPVNVALAS